MSLKTYMTLAVHPIQSPLEVQYPLQAFTVSGVFMFSLALNLCFYRMSSTHHLTIPRIQPFLYT